jgi:hypothetical protein
MTNAHANRTNDATNASADGEPPDKRQRKPAASHTTSTDATQAAEPADPTDPTDPTERGHPHPPPPSQLNRDSANTLRNPHLRQPSAVVGFRPLTTVGVRQASMQWLAGVRCVVE